MFTQPLLVVLVFIAILLYPYIFTIWTTTQRISQCQRFEATSPEDFPTEISELLMPYMQEFEAIDFELAQYVAVSPMTLGESPYWGCLLRNEPSQHYACLVALTNGNLPPQIFVEFTTFLLTDQILLTTSAKKYGMFKPYPPEIKQNLIGVSVQELWLAHQAKVTDLSLVPIALNSETFLQRLAVHGSDSVAYSVEHRRLRWVDPGTSFRIPLGTAIQLTFKIARDMHFSKIVGAPYAIAAQPSQVQQEVKTFLENQVPKPPMSKRKRGWLALGSLAAFAAVYATKFGPTTLVIFLAALILHEGGHLLAMLVFGYRNPAVLFIPYLGALATARKDHASLTEKVWISLAGPLPGLILGIAIAIIHTQGLPGPMALTHWYSDGNHWREASQILIGLNLFNLFPIYPLDGGQISDLLVFSRNPYLGVIYKSIGVALLLLLGLFNPLMFVFGLLMALSIPSSFRIARWFAKLRRELHNIPWQDDAASAELIFTRLQAAPKLSSAQKSMVAAGIIESRRADTAPWWSRLGLSAIYLVSLFGGITGGLYAIMPDFRMVSSSVVSAGKMFQGPEGHMRDRLKEADATITRNPQDLKAYSQRGYAKLYLKDTAGAIADANVILKQDPNSVDAYRLRARVYEAMGDRAKAQADQRKIKQIQWMPKLQAAQAALNRNPKDVTAYLQHAEAKLQLDDVKSAFQDWEMALKIDPKNTTILIARAEAKCNLKDFQGAFQDLEMASKINPKDIQVILTRAWYFEQQQDYPAALKEINRAIALEPNSIEAYDARSSLYEEMGESEKADADSAKVAELFEQSPKGKANPQMLEMLKRMRSSPDDD
jgi:tetratricopeptide (TPR) repeat protein